MTEKRKHELMQPSTPHNEQRQRVQSRKLVTIHNIHITDNNLIVQHTIIDKPVKRFQ